MTRYVKRRMLVPKMRRSSTSSTGWTPLGLVRNTVKRVGDKPSPAGRQPVTFAVVLSELEPVFFLRFLHSGGSTKVNELPFNRPD